MNADSGAARRALGARIQRLHRGQILTDGRRCHAVSATRLSQLCHRVEAEAARIAQGIWSASTMPPALRYGTGAARLLLGGDGARHDDLEEGLAWLAAAEVPATEGTTTAAMSGPMLHTLVLHLHLAAFLELYETLPQRLWGACEHHLPEAVRGARRVERYSDIPPEPTDVDQVLWDALCLYDQARALSRDVDTELVDGVVFHALATLAEEGETAVGPPTHELRRLRALHALADLALHRRDRTWARAAHDIARNVTASPPPERPWALFALAWSAPADAADEPPVGPMPQSPDCDAITLMLLADAVSALRCFGS